MATPPLVMRRISVDETIRMTEAGILGESERVELIDGQLVEMSPEGFGHHLTVRWLSTRLAAAALPLGYEVGTQTMLPLDAHRYLEPDVYVVRADTGAWAKPDEIPLLVEVSNTSRTYDLGAKAAEYARWGIGEYWVVDLVRCEVVVHTQPVDGQYPSARRVTGGAIEAPIIRARLDVVALLSRAESS